MCFCWYIFIFKAFTDGKPCVDNTCIIKTAKNLHFTGGWSAEVPFNLNNPVIFVS